MPYVTIFKEFKFEAAHQLPNHNGKCRNLHGHSYVAICSVDGDVSETEGASDEGMVMDFAAISEIMKPIVERLDHSFIVCGDEPAYLIAEQAGYTAKGGDRAFGKVCHVGVRTTAENLAKWIYEQVREQLPHSAALWITVKETAKTTATYHG